NTVCKFGTPERAIGVPGIDQVEAREVSIKCVRNSLAELDFCGNAESSVTRLNRLVYRAEFQSFGTVEIIRVLVVAGWQLETKSDGKVTSFRLRDRGIVCCDPDIAKPAAAGMIALAAVVTLVFV